MTANDWTFGLALIGYAMLGVDFVRQHARQATGWLSAATALVVVAHVVCVWALRFDWSLTRMLEKSLAGFLIFHTALLLIVAAPLMQKRRRLTTSLAFALVTAGALPAPFRYPELSLLLLPVLAIALASIVFAVRGSQLGDRLSGRAARSARTPRR